MKKILFLVLLLCGGVSLAHAGCYTYAGTNQLYNLLSAVDKTFELSYENGKLWTIPDDGYPGSSCDWYTVKGVCFHTLSGDCGVQPGVLDAIKLPYSDSGLWMLESIDWSGEGYRQKENVTLTLLQYPDPPDELVESCSYSEKIADNELQWLQSLNFSGNYFTSFKIDGAGRLDKLSLIDFSNNPTLQTLSVTGCTNPDLKVDISQNGFSFGKIWDLIEGSNPTLLDSKGGIISWLYYGNQGIIKRTFPSDRVDLSYDAEGFDQPTAYAFTDLDGVSLSPEKISAGVYSFDASYNGQKVYCNAKCGFFTQIPEGITFLITFTDDMSMDAIKAIECQSGVAYYNDNELIINSKEKSLTCIYSITGQKVLSSVASSINVSSLNRGCYIARITNEDGTVSTVKFVK